MTPERKAEINRRLAEFYEKATNYHAIAVTVDFTESLDALARLETKLPPHSWRIGWWGGVYSVRLLFQNELSESRNHATEAEARAEAICQYLESQDKR